MDMDMDMDMDDEEKPEEESIEPSFESKEDPNKSVDEHLREYTEMVKADMSGNDDGGAKKSAVASSGGAKEGGKPHNFTQGGEEKGGKAPSPKMDTEKYANRGGAGKVAPKPAPKPKTSE